MILSLRTRRYIADVWLGGYTVQEFSEQVESMDIPPAAKWEAKMFWHKLELSFLMTAPKKEK